MPEALPTPIHALRGLAVFAESPSEEHTDIADALALTFAYPVAKMLPREVREKISSRPKDYDPYDDM